MILRQRLLLGSGAALVVVSSLIFGLPKVASATAPAVTGVSPTSGTTTGGDHVTITGSGFTGATDVLITSGGTATSPGGDVTTAVAYPCVGTSPNGCFTVTSDTQIDMDTPDHDSGTYDIQVKAGGVTSSVVMADQFTYNGPNVDSISPTHGPDTGGTTVNVTGTGFTGVNRVQFGSRSIVQACPPTSAGQPCFTFNSDTSVTITNAPGVCTPQSRSVVVTTGAGSSAKDPAEDSFTWDTTTGTESAVLAPSVTASSSGVQHVVWDGVHDELCELAFSGGAWKGPNGLGMGPLGTAPSVTQVPTSGDVHVLWEGTDHNIWEAAMAGGTPNVWNGPTKRGFGPLGSKPAVTSWGNEIDVFWKGTDGNLWEAFSSDSGVHWVGPLKIGFGPIGSPTATARSNGEQDVFWRGTDGNLWEGFFNGSWHGPFTLGKFGPLGSPPTAASFATGEQDVYWKGTDNNIWEAYFLGGHWNGPVGVGFGPLNSGPAAVDWSFMSTTESDVFWQGTDRMLWEAFWNGSAWIGPIALGFGPMG